MLTGKDFIAVRITKFANDRVLLPYLIAFSRQVDHFAVAVLGDRRSVQIASHEIGIGHELFADEAGASQVDRGRRCMRSKGKLTVVGSVPAGAFRVGWVSAGSWARAIIATPKISNNRVFFMLPPESGPETTRRCNSVDCTK